MGLTVAIGNALSGLRAGQETLEVLSRNISNAGTPGYHKQSVNVSDLRTGGGSTYVRTGGVQRAFDQSLQSYYTRQISDTSAANVTATYLDRLQAALGKPGDASSLDTLFSKFQSEMSALSTGSDDPTVRARVVGAAQTLAGTLNTLSNTVQALRQETEQQMGSAVAEINSMLNSLQSINVKLGDQGIDSTSRATLLDQRDRLVASLSEQIDLRVEYRPDDSVALLTRSGVGVLDVKVSLFQFEGVGSLSPTALFDADDARNGVGTLKIVTPAGLELDMVEQNVLQGGELAALVNLRDKTLVEMQAQLDEIASGLAQAFSTVGTGTPATSGLAKGFSIDLADLGAGNDLTVDIVENGQPRSLRITDFSGGAAGVQTQLSTLLGPNFAVSLTGSTLTVVDDGAGNLSDVSKVAAHTTVAGSQNAGLGLALFVDSGNSDYFGSLNGNGQKLGFASRISINSDVRNNNALLVQSTPATPLGDTSRVDFINKQLSSMKFTSEKPTPAELGGFRLTGNVGELISQTLNYQGNSISAALTAKETQTLALDVTMQRMEEKYGVDVDEEMAKLMELQNAYAANARVVSVVQDLLDQLMNMI